VEWIRACFHPVLTLSLCTSRGVTTRPTFWRNAHQSALLLPPPQGLGWKVNDVGALEIKCTEGELMPQEVADIITDTLAGDDEDDRDSRAV